MRIWRPLHFWTGIVFVIIFLLTGQYMDLAHNHLEGMADGPRMIYRSGHIYILFAAVLNLVSGIYWNELPGFRKKLQILASVLLLLLPWVLLYGFFQEPHLKGLARPWSSMALYGTFGVAVVLAAVGIGRKE